MEIRLHSNGKDECLPRFISLTFRFGIAAVYRQGYEDDQKQKFMCQQTASDSSAIFQKEVKMTCSFGPRGDGSMGLKENSLVLMI